MERAFEAWRPRRAPRPCSLSLLALGPAVLIWAGTGLSVLAESRHQSPFWLRMGTTFQTQGRRLGKDKGKESEKIKCGKK